MSEIAVWIFLIVAAGLAIAVTRVNPTSWRPHHVRWVIIGLVIIAAATLMEVGLSRSPAVGVSGVSAGSADRS
jgi:hypothetical protein